ncbi:MAG: alpha/beta hydrolase [Gammaproteobacteria bacterium]|nr:alpha/beta hydrolase [Gammaproteobacteria bacterium]
MSHEKGAGKEPPKRKNKLEQLAGEKPPGPTAVHSNENNADALLGKRERSPRAQADVSQRSKLARMGLPESQAATSEESPRADSSGSKKSKQERMLGETTTETFVDPNYTESKSTVNLASVVIGRIICSVILTDRPTIPDETFKQNLSVVSQLAGDPKHSPLTIITEDGARVSGLKVEADPPTTKTIIAFQGQKGNFQDQQQLERVFEIARETGCNVVAFNYRDNPSSKQHFINDALTTTNYVTDRMGVSPKDISFYGESFGGTVAAETALQLKNNSEKEVKVVLFRTPKSLADAVKMIDLEALLKKPAMALLQEIKTKIGETQLVKYILNKGINGDFEAQEAVMQLNQDNVKCVRVEGDPIIHKKANVEHKNMSVCTTKEDDKHNASPSSLSDRSTKWVRAGQNATQERQNGFDLLREHSNPGFKQQQQVVSAAKK